jgi:hypothetical protein
VGFDLCDHIRVEDALQIVSDQLDDLLAVDPQTRRTVLIFSFTHDPRFGCTVHFRKGP